MREALVVTVAVGGLGPDVLVDAQVLLWENFSCLRRFFLFSSTSALL